MYYRLLLKYAEILFLDLFNMIGLLCLLVIQKIQSKMFTKDTDETHKMPQANGHTSQLFACDWITRDMSSEQIQIYEL